MPVAVVVIGKHGEDPLRREECGLAVRSLFNYARNRATDKAEPLELLAVVPFNRRPFSGESAFFRHPTIVGYAKVILSAGTNPMDTSPPPEKPETIDAITLDIRPNK